MFPTYIATGMPKINRLILLEFHFLSILECTVFCAVVHISLCKRGHSCFFIEGVTGSRKDFYVFGDG